MKTIYIILILIFSACESSTKTQTNHGQIIIDKTFYKSLNHSDTIIFTNPEFGSDTIVIDSVEECGYYKIDEIHHHESLIVYGKYICGSNVRLENDDISRDLRILNENGKYIYYSQKFKSQGQIHWFSLGEMLAGVDQKSIDTTSKHIVLPNLTYDAIITGDTIYVKPSEFHINQILWSYKIGPVGFVTLGNHVWAREINN